MKLVSTKEVFQAGFTLVELIIVIVVIGILAAVAIPKLTDVTEGATTAKDAVTLQAVQTAWSTAAIVAKGLPTVAQVLDQVSPTCTEITDKSANCSGKVISFTVTNGTLADPAAIN